MYAENISPMAIAETSGLGKRASLKVLQDKPTAVKDGVKI